MISPINRGLRHPWRSTASVWKSIQRRLKLPADAVRIDGRAVRIEEGHEADLSVRWWDAISPGDVIADVGAHHGHFSLFAAKKLGETGSVFAFEPLGPNVETIYKNIAANSFGCITVVHAGLSDTIGVELLYPSPKSQELTHFAGTPDGHPNTSPTVGWTLTLDSYFGALGSVPRVIKIDVDGDESRVLRGGESVLRDSGTRLFLENHYTSSTSQIEVLDLLSSYGFVIEIDRPKGDASKHRHVIGVFK